MQVIQRKIRSAIWRLQNAIRQAYQSTLKFAVELITERYWLLDYLPTFFKKRDGVLLVRLDLIGDFVLWLDSAQAYRRLYPNQKITLAVNSACAELASSLPYWDSVIGISVHDLRTNYLYRFSTLVSLRWQNFALTIQPTFSREFAGDLTLRASAAPERIGYVGDANNLTVQSKLKTDRWYSKLIENDPTQSMELNINAHFVRMLGDHNFLSRAPALGQTMELPEHLRFSDAYIVVAPSASWQGKMWPTKKFASVAREIAIEFDIQVLVCGGVVDRSVCAELTQLIDSDKVHDLSGQTTLLAFIEIIRHAKLVLTNDSAAVHISAATGTPSVCTVGGGHFSRFLPYTPEYTNGSTLPTVVSYVMECYGCRWQCIYSNESSQAVPCVEKISTTAVHAACLRYLSP